MFFGGAIASASRAGTQGSIAIPFTEETCSPNQGTFPEQWRLVECDSLAICLMCSRRSGKTSGLVQRTAKLSWEQPGRRTLYIHHTLENGRNQFFRATSPGEVALLDVFEKHRIGFEADNVNVNVSLENGSFVQVVGCDNLKQVRKKLGYHWDEVILDEAQEHDHALLKLLVTTVILPTLIDTMGTLILSGTPSKVEAGFWYETIRNPRFLHLGWNMLSNPVISRDSIVESMGKAGYTIDFGDFENNDPLVQREVFGIQVVDSRDLVYPYVRGLNDWPADGIHDVKSPKWLYAMGIDIGGANPDNDRDAVVVWGWRSDDGDHRVYERESWEERQLDSEQFCERVVQTYQRWRPMYGVCGDTGGAGANKALAVISKRLQGMQFTPKPTSLEMSMRLFCDEIRSRRMKVDPNGLVARDMKLCTRDGLYHSDIMAAGRYGYECVYNWLGQEDKTAGMSESEAVWARRLEQLRWQANSQKQSRWRMLGGKHPLAT